MVNQQVPAPKNSVYYRLGQITRELRAQHEVQAGANNVGRIDVHMLRGRMAPHLPPC